MEKIINEITCSVQALTTMAAFSTTTGVSGSTVVDMSKYNNVVARVHMAKLPDNKGALCAATLSLYECLSTGLTGSLITASVATSSLISNSAETMIQTEIKAADLSPNFRYVYAHFNANTKSDCSVIIERGKPRYSYDV
jgi:hypothetical protein